MTWILILYIYAGALSKSDSVALTNVQGFATEQTCKIAGDKADALVEGSFKNVRYIYVKG